jgi:alanyl-tRNA synthetase
MLADPKNKEWRKYSVEFCGGTHNDKTGIIKDLIIVEESGIAKGIRRIVAYTGDAAHAAQREAKLFAERIARVAKMPYGPEKTAEIKKIKVDLEGLTISTLTKKELNDQFAKVTKEDAEEGKKRQKAESKAAMDTVQGHFKKEGNEDAKWFVGHVPVSANPKAVSEIISYYKSKEKEKSVYVFAGDKNDAVFHGVYVGTVSHPSTLDMPDMNVSLTDLAASRIQGRHGRGVDQGRQ